MVIFKDDGDKAGQVLPFSTMNSEDPESLWKYMAGYEEKTGGSVLAIPHNGNLSNGQMFPIERMNGKPIDSKYAKTRRRWEPLIEVTQMKGDSEAHPFLSPDDEFADYGTWDMGDIAGQKPKEDWLVAGSRREVVAPFTASVPTRPCRSPRRRSSCRAPGRLQGRVGTAIAKPRSCPAALHLTHPEPPPVPTGGGVRSKRCSIASCSGSSRRSWPVAMRRCARSPAPSGASWGRYLESALRHQLFDGLWRVELSSGSAASAPASVRGGSSAGRGNDEAAERTRSVPHGHGGHDARLKTHQRRGRLVTREGLSAEHKRRQSLRLSCEPSKQAARLGAISTVVTVLGYVLFLGLLVAILG